MEAHPSSVRNYLNRIGATVLGPNKAIVRDWHGNYYEERAFIRLSKEGITAPPGYRPTPDEEKEMSSDLARYPFPKSIHAPDDEGLREAIEEKTGKKPGEVNVFHGLDGKVIMAQQVIRHPNGTKDHISWCMLDDGKWWASEPTEEKLPVWLPNRGDVKPGGWFMAHEGAKAAQAAQRIVDLKMKEHPWYHFIKLFTHVGIIGGALAPHRTNFKTLRELQPSHLVYVCDNDIPGKAALAKVSRVWKGAMQGIIFPDNFPSGFDLADPFPEEMFSRSGRYIGPKPEAMLVPATWATEQMPNPAGQGRPVTRLSEHFIREWRHCVRPDVYVDTRKPSGLWTQNEFNDLVRPFSHVENTAILMKRHEEIKATVIGYDPGSPPGLTIRDDAAFLNTCEPSLIRPDESVNPGPFLAFMEHLVPDEAERKELMRWCATLIARPGTRMAYGVLLVSDRQGVGKSTLGEKILRPLVGARNTSVPNEQEIVDSNFNGWIGHKRLAVVHEIYQGRSWKAYNRLKSIITDQQVTINRKYMTPYDIENWMHIFACSNDNRALRMAGDDRRWFVPTVTDYKQPHTWWADFNDWLTQDGGLEGIAAWAERFVAKHGAVQFGDEAPMTGKKMEMIVETYSPGQLLVERLLVTIKEKVERGELPADCFVLDTQLRRRIQNEVYEGRDNANIDGLLQIRKTAKTLGFNIGKERSSGSGWPSECFLGRIISLDSKTAGTPPLTWSGVDVPAGERRMPLDITLPGVNP